MVNLGLTILGTFGNIIEILNINANNTNDRVREIIFNRVMILSSISVLDKVSIILIPSVSPSYQFLFSSCLFPLLLSTEFLKLLPGKTAVFKQI